jgi:UDP-N-acetylmuramate--alanine ligase
MGLEVSGSDMNSSVSTDELISHGIQVAIGHREENIAGAHCVIRTAAAHNDNPEIQAARAAGIPVFERAQAWGVIMQEYKHAICFSGTHGKTTATSMMTHILMAAQWDPTVMIGGYLPILHAGHRVGHGDAIVMESCEYCNSFLNFFPTVAVILNIEEDHMDYFHSMKEIEESFHRFAELATDRIIANGDDANTRDALEGMDYISFGFGEHNRIRAVNLSSDCRHFDVLCDGESYCHLDLQVLGEHNVLNALAAVAAAWVLGVPAEAVCAGLATFTGANRRMQFKGEYNGAQVYDDYAHHPGELAATLKAVRSMGDHRVILAFQPHTYTRTKALFHDFVRELPKADVVILSDIYAAREKNTVGISSEDLCNEIPGSIYCKTLQDVTQYLRSIAQPGDLILTVGAGDIYLAGDALLDC